MMRSNHFQEKLQSPSQSHSVDPRNANRYHTDSVVKKLSTEMCSSSASPQTYHTGGVGWFAGSGNAQVTSMQQQRDSTESMLQETQEYEADDQLEHQEFGIEQRYQEMSGLEENGPSHSEEDPDQYQQEDGNYVQQQKPNNTTVCSTIQDCLNETAETLQKEYDRLDKCFKKISKITGDNKEKHHEMTMKIVKLKSDERTVAQSMASFFNDLDPNNTLDDQTRHDANDGGSI